MQVRAWQEGVGGNQQLEERVAGNDTGTPLPHAHSAGMPSGRMHTSRLLGGEML